MQKFVPPPNEQFESFDAIEPVATIVYPTFSGVTGDNNNDGEQHDSILHYSEDNHVSNCPTFLDCLNWLSKNGYS